MAVVLGGDGGWEEGVAVAVGFVGGKESDDGVVEGCVCAVAASVAVDVGREEAESGDNGIASAAGIGAVSATVIVSCTSSTSPVSDDVVNSPANVI